MAGAACGLPGEAEAPRAVSGAGARLQSSSAVLELGRKLLHAAREGDTAAVLALMTKGAPFTTDWLGTSPLHLAAMNAHEETCRVLLRAGISRDTRTKVERTPLHLAAYEGHAAVCELLLSHGAAHDCRDMLQMTPLHWAVERGHLAAARALLAAGADPHAVSKFRKTPLSLAEAAGDERMLALLQEAALQQDTERWAGAPPIPSPPPPAPPVAPAPPPAASDTQPACAVGGERAASGTGAAAALLRQHGITLLPTDTSSTLLAAMRSGRTVVLSDAGKLLLKESGPAAPVPAPRPPKVAKIFTINSNRVPWGMLRSMPRVRRVTPLAAAAATPTAAAAPSAAQATPLKGAGGTVPLVSAAGAERVLQQLRAADCRNLVIRPAAAAPSAPGAPAGQLKECAGCAWLRGQLEQRTREVRALKRRLLVYEPTT